MATQEQLDSREKLNKTLHDLGQTVGDLTAKNQALGSRLEAMEASLKDAHSKLVTANAAAEFAQAQSNRSNGADWEIESTYCQAPTARNALLDLGSTTRSQVSHEVPFVGKDTGSFQCLTATDENGMSYPGLFDDPNPINEWQREVQRAFSQRSFVRQVLLTKASPEVRAQIAVGARKLRTPRCDRALIAALRRGPPQIARIFSDSAGIGAEWIPDNFAPAIFEFAQLERRLEGAFENVDMPAGGSWLIPRSSAGATPYIIGAPTTDNPSTYPASTITTAQNSTAPPRLAVNIAIDIDLSEDAVLASQGVILGAGLKGLVDGYEDCMINGDIGTHGDTGLSGWNPGTRWASGSLGQSYDHRRQFIGLRQRAIDISTHASGASVQTLAGLGACRARMSGPQSVGACAIVTSAKYYILKMVMFSEFLTAEKFGPAATNASGALAIALGMPIYLSDFMSIELNASGIYDNSTKTKTGLLVVNRGAFRNFARKGVTFASQDDITRGTRNLVWTQRKTFATVEASTDKNVAYDYELSIS